MRPKRHLPSREQQVKSLKTENFDVVIIGGGATGGGCALDAITRGSIIFGYYHFIYCVVNQI